MSQHPSKGKDLISRVLNAVAGGTLFLMMLLTAIDVVLRYAFNRPIGGTYEITELMMVIVIFFALAYTQATKAHVSVDFLVARLSKRKQKIIDFLNHALAFAMLLLMTIMSFIKAFQVMTRGEVSPTLSIPVYPFFLLVGLGCAAMCGELLRQISAMFEVRQ